MNRDSHSDAQTEAAEARSRRASELCLIAMMGQVIEAGSIAKAPAALIEGGDYKRAFQAALEIEPLLHDADHALQSASIFRRLARAEA